MRKCLWIMATVTLVLLFVCGCGTVPATAPSVGTPSDLPDLPDATTTTTTTTTITTTTTTTQPTNTPVVPVLPDNAGVLFRLYDGSPVYKTTADAEIIARARALLDTVTLTKAADQEPRAGGWQLHVDFPDGTGYAVTGDAVEIDGVRYTLETAALDTLITQVETLWEDVDVPAQSLLNYEPYTEE